MATESLLFPKAMASLCFNSLPLPPPSQPRKLSESPLPPPPPSSSSSSSSSFSSNSLNVNSYGSRGEALKPIVVSGSPPTFVSAPGRRIVAVGDLHGDLGQTRCALETAGVLSPDGEDVWIGGETVLIQLGDILDRGEDEIAILSLLRSLDMQAKAEGGAVFQVNGNHETINVEGDFRYVDTGGFDECLDFLEYLDDNRDDWEEAFVGWVGVSKRMKEERKMPQNYWDPWNLVRKQKGVIARSILLRPGGPLARELARHAVVLKVNDWVFCHGGLVPQHVYIFLVPSPDRSIAPSTVTYGVERMNREVSDWMRGLVEIDDNPHFPFVATRGYDSVVWNRLYSRDTSDLDDYQINQANATSSWCQGNGGGAYSSTYGGKLVRCQAFFCPVRIIYVNLNEYDCSIWRIDVGMSSGVLNSRPEVLEIKDNKARVIRSKKDPSSELTIY
ncbi:hypothetical protein DVH24_041732 [Malus domestica]|uniref:Calcineurin-like phosphoesterase domain-containing protein n=1 Tax=Malus domestica TaxID=3750 RepID=A0A498IRZ3_MALDO|nr:hypothetical protein DVH24_041732 [Malus domestica]